MGKRRELWEERQTRRKRKKSKLAIHMDPRVLKEGIGQRKLFQSTISACRTWSIHDKQDEFRSVDTIASRKRTRPLNCTQECILQWTQIRNRTSITIAFPMLYPGKRWMWTGLPGGCTSGAKGLIVTWSATKEEEVTPSEWSIQSSIRASFGEES